MKLRRMKYSETQADGIKVSKKSAKWYAVFMDFTGALRRFPLFEDRRASAAMANIVDRLNSLRSSNETLPPDLARAVDEMPAGILARLAKWDIIRSERAASSKPLADHVEDWKAALLAKGNTSEYAALSANRVKRIVADCRLTTVADVSASRVQTFLAGLRQDSKNAKGKIHRGIGAASFNYYLRDARSFFRWMVRDGRAFENPLAHLQGVNAGMDKRHERRALSVDELRLLLDTAATGPDRNSMSGTERAMLYRVAVETGLRAAELRSLTRASFKLEGGAPAVTIAAAYAKNRRQDEQPLRMSTAAALAVQLTGKMPTAPAFAMPPRNMLVKMFRADLAAARTAWIAAAGTQQERTGREGSTFLAYCDETSRCADFHALRHTFISNLVAGGVHPKTAQRLARHSTITLTMDRYTHLWREDLAGAVDSLPDLSITRQANVATGTAGVEISLAPSLPPNGNIQRHAAQLCANESGRPASNESRGKAPGNTDFPGRNIERPRSDSNRRITDLQSVPLVHLGTRPRF
jgi:integrase